MRTRVEPIKHKIFFFIESKTFYHWYRLSHLQDSWLAYIVHFALWIFINVFRAFECVFVWAFIFANYIHVNYLWAIYTRLVVSRVWVQWSVYEYNVQHMSTKPKVQVWVQEVCKFGIQVQVWVQSHYSRRTSTKHKVPVGIH